MKDEVMIALYIMNHPIEQNDHPIMRISLKKTQGGYIANGMFFETDVDVRKIMKELGKMVKKNMSLARFIAIAMWTDDLREDQAGKPQFNIHLVKNGLVANVKFYETDHSIQDIMDEVNDLADYFERK